jgi:hypothetical protein
VLFKWYRWKLSDRRQCFYIFVMSWVFRDINTLAYYSQGIRHTCILIIWIIKILSDFEFRGVCNKQGKTQNTSCQSPCCYGTLSNRTVRRVTCTETIRRSHFSAIRNVCTETFSTCCGNSEVKIITLLNLHQHVAIRQRVSLREWRLGISPSQSLSCQLRHFRKLFMFHVK